MRIGIYDPYLDDVGGGEKYMMTIASCLAKQHEVDVFWNHAKDIAAIKRRFSLDLDNVTLVKNIFASDVSFLQKIQESRNYDAIIVLSDGSVPLLASKKLFLHVQQPLGYIHGLSWKEKLKLKRVTQIFYNSQFTKTYNDKFFSGISNTVIYPPVALHNKKEKKENIILHVGRFRVQDMQTGIKDFKKQTVMIEAFKDMVDKEQSNNWKLCMAVSVKEEDEEKFTILREAARDYPIEFFVNKTNDELWSFYNKAKIYWHASGYGEDLEKHPEFAEHFGISTVEAMGAGAVPVVINAGGQKEIVTDGENGLLWNTREELQNQTMKLMKDQKLLTELAENAQLRAKDFTTEVFCEEINQLIMK